jgi:hypothetical protein
MNFENQMKLWVELDNQLKELNENIKLLREKKNNVEKNITNYANLNNLSNSIFEINNDKIKITKTNVIEPLTFKYLEKKLNEVIKNENQAKVIMEYIKKKREIKVIPEIKRIYNN